MRVRSILVSIAAAIALILLIVIWSRGFHWFDASLIGYAACAIFAAAAITYKYTFWLARTPTHRCIFWGVVLSCLITFPLTFGWLRFTQTPSGLYLIWVCGFPLFLPFPSTRSSPSWSSTPWISG